MKKIFLKIVIGVVLVCILFVCFLYTILCPICRNKTRIKIRGDTVLENFPLYCPKCKQENLIRAYQLNIIVIKEPDAQTQSR